MEEVDETQNSTPPDDDGRPPSERTTLDFDQPDSLIGQRLDGRFFIEKNLTDSGADAGGIGLVYLAKDVKLMNKRVVVKILREDALKNEDIVRKFMHEKEALIRLDHPGIVRILDSGNLMDGNPFMVMDYIEGGSLRQKLRLNRQMPLDYVAHVIESVTDALGAAHSEQIIHRDIKPENIMLTPRDDGFDRVRLIDFGIARVGGSTLAPVTEIGRLVGTVIYIAPEQLIGNLDLTPAVDVYAMSIVAYEMITGELPFYPRAIAEMYQLQKNGVKVWPGELRRDLPRVAETVLMAGLEFEVKKRPQNIRAWGRGLARELRNEMTMSTDRSTANYNTEFANSMTEITAVPDASEFLTKTKIMVPPETVQPPRRFKWLVPSLLALVLLSIAGGAIAWKFSGSKEVQSPPVVNVAPEDTRPERNLSYFLMVQKIVNGVKKEAPFKSAGKGESFESGYEFTMTFQSEAEGYIYVFNDGPNANGIPEIHLLSPTPNINGGSARVIAGQQVVTAPMRFAPGKGLELMWFVWSKDRRDDLESVTASALSSPDGKVNDKNTAVLRDFFDKYNDESRKVTVDKVNERTLITGKGDVVLDRFELNHR